MISTLVRLLATLLVTVQVCAMAATVNIRTAAQDSQPKFIRQGDAFAGICIDVFNAIERIDPGIKFGPLTQFEPLPRIEYMLEAGDYDAFCGMARTADREKRFRYIDIPIYTTHSVLAARSDDNVSVRDLDELRRLGDDGLVLVVTKSVHAQDLKLQSGINFMEIGTNISDNLKLLLRGRGRFVFHSDLTLTETIAKEGLDAKVKILPTKFFSEGRYFVVSKKAPRETQERLTAALETLRKKGELSQIAKSYER